MPEEVMKGVIGKAEATATRIYAGYANPKRAKKRKRDQHGKRRETEDSLQLIAATDVGASCAG